MGEPAVDHVGHGFEAAVRMPVRASGLAGLVLDLAHLIHVHERVEVSAGNPREGADHREPLAFIARASGCYPANRPFRIGGGGPGDAGQLQNISGDSRHTGYNRTAVRFIPGMALPCMGRSDQLIRFCPGFVGRRKRNRALTSRRILSWCDQAFAAT